MNQAGNLTASPGLFQMEVCEVQGEENGIGNLLCHLLRTHRQPLCHLRAAVKPLEEKGRGRDISSKPFQQLPHVPDPRDSSSLMFDPLFFSSRIAEGASVGTQKQRRSMNGGVGSMEQRKTFTDLGPHSWLT